LCTPDRFKYVKDVKYLDPTYRQKMLVADLRELKADIICL
jgi:mRNA deadenylase 3'-5' endonuclease subunit Ccr4